MKRIVPPNQVGKADMTPPVKDPPMTDISISRLMDDSLLVLYREVKNLLILSASGKLLPEHAKDLRDHLKLLFELKDRESELLGGLTDEELKATAKTILNEDKNQ